MRSVLATGDGPVRSPGAVSTTISLAGESYMPGLDSGHLEKGAPPLPMTSRQEGQAWKRVRRMLAVDDVLQLCSTQSQVPPDLGPRTGPKRAVVPRK